jgi:hypothetical protein
MKMKLFFWAVMPCRLAGKYEYLATSLRSITVEKNMFNICYWSLVTVTWWYRTKRPTHSKHFLTYYAIPSEL